MNIVQKIIVKIIIINCMNLSSVLPMGIPTGDLSSGQGNALGYLSFHRNYRNIFGQEPASEQINQELEEVKMHFAKCKLLDSKAIIDVNYFSEDGLQILKKQGMASQINAINNGINGIHLHKRFEEIPEAQRKQALAHEVAHIVLNKNSWLNPHCWVDKTILGSISALYWASMASSLSMLYYEKRNQQKSYKWAGNAVGLFVGCFGLIQAWSFIPMEDDYSSACGIRYPFATKYEEIMCDLVAAYVMPNGTEAGKQLFQSFRKLNGNRNGLKGDHPWTHMRVKYHSLLQKFQTNFVARKLILEFINNTK